eukprot:12347077-Ditylum_brightwellii.AAC.1
MNDAEMALDTIKSGLAKDNDDIELNRLALKYNEMPSNIMSNCKKHHYCKHPEEPSVLIWQKRNE